MADFDPSALERGIAQCRANIAVFEEAIEKERATMREYRDMIDAIERRERAVETAKAKVHVEIEDGG